MMLNGEGTILSLSDNLQEYFSLRIPVSLKTLIDWERSPFQTFHECMNTLKRGEHVYLFFKKRKTASVLFLVMIQQKREEKGNITLMLQHIPHERQLEIELRQQKRYTNEIISMANIVFIRTDARYCIKDMNPWAEKVLHLHKQERINQHIFDVLQIKTSDREKVRILLKEKGQCQDLEITYHTPDGEEKTLLWNIKLLIDFQYGQSVLLFFGHDITERTRLKTQMAQSEKLAALGQLAGGIAHDISKPLVSMSSLIQMLQATVLDDSMESTLKVINQQIDYLSKTLRQLVDLSKPLHGEKEIININTLLEDALRIVRFDTYLRNVHIIYESPTEKAVVC
ncbi:MAG: PAS domain-containing protein, partial [Candidatus Marinimicrobia bacterium]|nr:PAS domain-containing protein [Candidatus Neomarinimicrobiota bacterium]